MQQECRIRGQKWYAICEERSMISHLRGHLILSIRRDKFCDHLQAVVVANDLGPIRSSLRFWYTLLERRGGVRN
jgi:hypothetical protein